MGEKGEERKRGRKSPFRNERGKKWGFLMMKKGVGEKGRGEREYSRTMVTRALRYTTRQEERGKGKDVVVSSFHREDGGKKRTWLDEPYFAQGE